MSGVSFSSKTEFTQVAFNEVARIVSQHGSSVLDCLVPAFSTEQCLSHLALVAYEYAYDASFIDAHLEIFKKSNAELQDISGGV